MNELDFDELDKAVNTLMSGMSTEKRNTALDDPEDNVVSLDGVADTSAGTPGEQSKASSATPVSTEAAAPSLTASSAPQPSQPLAVKRRGQFMDMIHPSSDMKTTSAPKREGISLQPSSPFVPPALSQFGAGKAGTELTAEPAAPVLDVVTPTPTEAPAFAADHKDDEPAKSEWPDPIELANKADAQSTQEESKPSDVPSDVIQEVAAPVHDEPLVSPFLPDAKVEKRPLGGGMVSDAPNDSEPATGESVPDAGPITPPVQLPEELNTDVMALESTSTNGAPTTSAEVTASKDTAAVQAPAVQPESPKTEPMQTGSGSIPQQYKEQPSTGDRTNASIYDTSTHQPLAVAGKKSSPVKWIVLALVLLIIGAIAGVAYFYFTTH